MSATTPPSAVRQVLTALQARGHLAYLVGGCVRDMLLGVTPHDWDICTSARPEEVLAIFPHAEPTGLKHGTVTVWIRKRAIEVTTFRSEGSYSDHRHPDAVSFVGDLHTDLSRRDFTMNAIALPPDGLIADPFGGIDDIRNRLIRCVGEPERRFEEDALRMLRAFRFAARLDFTIEEKTLAAIYQLAPLSAALACERVRDEVEKLLLSPHPELFDTLLATGLFDRYLLHRPEGALPFQRLALLPRKSLLRWCAAAVVLKENGCIVSVHDFLAALRLDNRTLHCCTDAAELLEEPASRSAVEWKRQLRDYGVETVRCSARVRDALRGGRCDRALAAVLKRGECFSMKHLAVGGDDLLALGLRGRELGDMLNFLLDYVITFPENNTREVLLNLAKGTEE